MTNLLSSGVEWLSSQLQSSAATAIVYHRSETDGSAHLTVTAGQTRREQQSDRGLVNIVRAVDVIVPVSAFESAFGTGVRPDDGDEVVMCGRSYKVRPLGGEPGWRYSDQTQVQMRIHLKDEGPTA